MEKDMKKLCKMSNNKSILFIFYKSILEGNILSLFLNSSIYWKRKLFEVEKLSNYPIFCVIVRMTVY